MQLFILRSAAHMLNRMEKRRRHTALKSAASVSRGCHVPTECREWERDNTVKKGKKDEIK